MVKLEVAVLGAGVSGLSCAVLIQRTRPDCHVTLISDQFSPNTTSDVSGGFWYPYALSDTDPAIIRETSYATYEYLKTLAMSSQAPLAGVQMITGYQYSDTTMEDDPISEYMGSYRRLTQEELNEHPGYRMGFTFLTVTVDVTTYLTWLMTQFRSNGGTVIQKKCKSLTELIGQYDVVINCCGLGNAQLVNDRNMFPARGQVIRVEAPWIKQFHVFLKKDQPNVYMLPNIKCLVVGGTCERDDWNVEVVKETEKDIWDRAVQCMPSLTHAKKITSQAALRPCRTKLRLEAETIRSGAGSLRVIHNYGHGGAGVTMHWGCSLKTVSMLDSLLPPGTGKFKDNYSNSGPMASTNGACLKHKL